VLVDQRRSLAAMAHTCHQLAKTRPGSSEAVRRVPEVVEVQPRVCESGLPKCCLPVALVVVPARYTALGPTNTRPSGPGSDHCSMWSRRSETITDGMPTSRTAAADFVPGTSTKPLPSGQHGQRAMHAGLPDASPSADPDRHPRPADVPGRPMSGFT
jgi:hypothetical protein